MRNLRWVVRAITADIYLKVITSGGVFYMRGRVVYFLDFFAAP